MNQQVPIEGRGDIEGRRREREEDARNDAEPPAVQQRVENNNQPQWRLFSRVDAVLLDGLPHPRNMMLNDFLRRNFGRRYNVNEENNVSMFVFVLEPEEYINDVNALNRIFATTEYKVYKRFVSVYGFFEDEGILNLQRWQQADEVVKARLQVNIRGLRDGERLWIVVTNMLNDALNEALQGAILAAGGAVNLEGVYDSIYNAKWSHIIIDNGTQPLGMRLVDGMPNEGLMWKEEEVDVVPEIEEALEQKPERTKGVELLVLTSEMGWPYTGFARGSNSDIFIRREELRVWNVVRNGIELWRTQRALPGCLHFPRAYLAIGNPGIGKSQNLGSFILYNLLHYDAEELPVVAYFRGVAAYIFEKSGGGGVCRVKKYSKGAAMDLLEVISSNTRGYVIYDFVKKGEQPPADVAPKWGSILISSPNLRNFDSWFQQRERCARIVVNCWEMTEMRAFFSRIGPMLYPEATPVGLREKWEMYESRVEFVGPSLRYVFDGAKHATREDDIDNEINSIKSHERRELYIGVVGNKGGWRESDASHKLVKIVRACGRNNGEIYICVPHSESIKKRIIQKICEITAQNLARLAGLIPTREMIPALFEYNAIKALGFPKVLSMITQMTKPLPERGVREQEIAQNISVLRHVEEKYLNFGNAADFTDGYGMVIRSPSLFQAYKALPNFPVLDAFFVVDPDAIAEDKKQQRREKKTIVMLQYTTAESHDTKTGTVLGMLKKLLNPTTNPSDEYWKEVMGQYQWEMIYVQHPDATPMRVKQRCDFTDGKADDENHRHVEMFWKNDVKQYLVKFDVNIVKALTTALFAEQNHAAPTPAAHEAREVANNE
uniref:RHS6a n=1 Tax=Trypanosoma brucei TaxID=5691 RepID=Q8T9M4_9TRYP|nr:RHS6a [Trypanosoma brucei]